MMRERFGRTGLELRSRARDQAVWLIRDHGPDAEAFLEAKMKRNSNSRADRYRYRCTERELKRLRAIEARQLTADARSRALVVYKPPVLSRRGLAALFGFAKR